MKSLNTYQYLVTPVSPYHPFGMIMSERSFSSEKYRYGFNGKEKTDEINGEGHNLDFGARGYDSRVGRFFSIDRYFSVLHFYSPYQFAGNSPLKTIDNNGDILRIINSGAKKEQVEKFKTILNTAFAGIIIVSVDENGYVTLTGDATKLDSKQKQLYENLYNITNVSKYTTYIGLSTDDKFTLLGEFEGAIAQDKETQANLIDLYDIGKIINQDITQASIIMHEIYESYRAQIFGEDYDPAHRLANNVQGRICGVTIYESFGDKGSQTDGTGSSYMNYEKDGKMYCLKIIAINNVIQSATKEEGWAMPSDSDLENITIFKTKEEYDAAVVIYNKNKESKTQESKKDSVDTK